LVGGLGLGRAAEQWFARLRLDGRPVRHLLGIAGLDVLLLQAGPALLEPGEATSPGGEAGWQLIAPDLLTQQVVLSPVGGRRFRQHRLHLGFDGLPAAVGLQGRVGLDLGAVKGHHPYPDQSRRRAQPKDLGEAGRQGLLVRLAEPGDGAVVGRGVGRDHAEGDVLVAPPLDPAA